MHLLSHCIFNVPEGVPKDVVEKIETKTPGYETWQGNRWLFSNSDALVFLGEVIGIDLIRDGDESKVAACLNALTKWNIPSDFDLSQIVIGGESAVYLFQD